MKLTHSDLLNLQKLLGYKNFSGGLCAGFSGMWMQAVLAQDETTFYKRLAFIAQYKDNFTELVNEINKAQKKPKTELNEQDRQLLDILAFFDGIELYLSPGQHRDYFPEQRYVFQDDICSVFPLANSCVMDKGNLEILLNKDYSFTTASLTNFLNDLVLNLDQIKSPLPIILCSQTHSVCLKYDSQKSCWHYVDTNDFEQDSLDETYFRELDTPNLTNSIFKSFGTSTHAVFNFRLMTSEANDKLKEGLQQLNSLYPLDKKLVSQCDDNKTSVVHIASQQGHLETVKDLLKFNSKTKIIDKAGQTPIYSACYHGHRDILIELLKHPHYKKHINKKADDSSFPFYIACQNGHTELVIELLKPEYQTDIYKTKNNGTTSFYIACQEGHEGVVLVLLKHQYKKYINKAMDDGATPFYIACQRGRTNIVKELLKPEYGTKINKSLDDGTSPLHTACYEGHTEIVRELLASPLLKKIDPTQLKGYTPLELACSSPQTKENETLFQLLLEHGASLTHRNNKQQTALDIAYARNNQAAINAIVRYAKIKNLDLQKIMSARTLAGITDRIKEPVFTATTSYSFFNNSITAAIELQENPTYLIPIY